MKKLAGLPIVLVMAGPQIGTAAEPGWGGYASSAIAGMLDNIMVVLLYLAPAAGLLLLLSPPQWLLWCRHGSAR